MSTTQIFSVAVLPTFICLFAVLPSLLIFLELLCVAAAGELAKDQRHLDAVEEMGCNFISLVVEIRLWYVVALYFVYATDNWQSYHSS